MATYGAGTYGSGTYGSLSAGTYEKTGVCVAGTRAAGAREGGTAVAVVATVIPVREKPPLRVTMDIETPGGKHYRWAEDEPAPENVPNGLRWSDTMPGGFESMDCTLPRKSGIDYSDLEQLSTIRVLGAGGGIAGEYRLERSPRTSGDEVSISPGAVGWQAHLEDDKSAAMIYVDRDLSRWEGMDTERRAAATLTFAVGDTDVVPHPTLPALRLAFEGAWAPAAGFRAEAFYRATAGVNIKRVTSLFEANANVNAGANGNWAGFFETSDDGHTAFFDASADFLTADAPNGGIGHNFTTPRPVVRAQFAYIAGPAGADGTGFELFLPELSVYGDHDVTHQAAGDGEGFLASGVVAHAVSRWAPLLNVTAESVQPSGFVIEHLAFPEPTTAGEIIRQTTRFGLQDWAIWDNKTFWWHERGAFSKLWRTRVAPAQLDETGPQVDRLWESIIVQYQDVDGTTKTVGPPGSGANVEDASLKDSDPDNPANQLGIIRRDILQMGTTTSAGAIEVGRRFLEESQQLDRSGRARIVGHVEDSSGVLHPYWRPRAGDYISFIDAADTSYRRIVRTDKSHSDRTCSLDLDAPPEGLKALLERLGVVLVPLGLS